MTGIAFSAVYKSIYGDTVAADDPRREAYKQAAYIRFVLKRRYSLTSRPGDIYTVEGDGLAPLTFEPVETIGKKPAGNGTT